MWHCCRHRTWHWALLLGLVLSGAACEDQTISGGTDGAADTAAELDAETSISSDVPATVDSEPDTGTTPEEVGQSDAPADTDGEVQTDTGEPTDSAADTDSAALTDVAVETDSAVQTDAAAETDTAALTDAAAETDTAALTDAAAETDTAALTDAAAETDTAALTDVAAETDTTGLTDVAAETDTTGLTDVAAETDTAALTDAAAETDTAALTEVDAESDTAAQTDGAVQPDTEPATDTAAMTDVAADTDAASPADAAMDAATGADALDATQADAATGDDAMADSEPGDTSQPECSVSLPCAATSAVCLVTSCLDGSCVVLPAQDATPCTDGDACTDSDACQTGVCKGVAVVCDDGLSCTADTCDPTSGCLFAHVVGACDDGDACSQGETCQGGACVGGPISCDDNQPCTLDSCKDGACVNAEVAGCFAVPCGSDLDCSVGSCDPVRHVCRQCDVDSDCGSGAWCSAHVCQTGTACTSDTQCKATNQVCNLTQGVCVDCVSAGDCGLEQACVESVCVAAKPCTSSKQCPAVCDLDAGVCVECKISADCNPGSWCDASSHVCRPDVCAWSQCLGAKTFDCLADGSGYGAATTCAANNPCAADACASQTGCYTVPISAACNDGDACTLGDQCGNGTCVPGPLKVCTDGNACTVDQACMAGSCPVPVSQVGPFIGSGAAGYANGAGAQAAFSTLRGLAVGPDGTLYVAEVSSIRKVTPQGVTSTMAGGPTPGNVDGPLGTGMLYGAWGIALAANGDVYFTDRGNHKVRKASPDGTLTTIAGTGGQPGYVNGAAMQAKFDGLSGIVLEPDGGVVVAEYEGARLRRIKDGVVTTLAGTGAKGTADGLALQAQLYTPGFLLRSPEGHIYIADVESHRIRKLSVTGVVTTLAGGTQGYQNGNGSNARFAAPEQMVWVSDTEFLVAELFNHRIRKVTVNGDVSWYGGTGSATSASGTLATASFHEPVGLASAAGGVLYISERAVNLVRKIVPKDINCHDNDQCTIDFCSPGAGCQYTPGVLCEDGNPCTAADTCNEGSCEGGGPASCDDGNACTVDQCGPAGCTHTNLAAGDSCGSGLTCNNLTQCTCGNGICEMGEHCCEADCGICGPSWYWSAVAMDHTIGEANKGGWYCDKSICPKKDAMVYGPDAKFLSPGNYKVSFAFKAEPNCTMLSCYNTHLANIDVCINDGLTILNSAQVWSNDISAAIETGNWTERSLTFSITGQSTVEFRVWSESFQSGKIVVNQIRLDKL